MSIVQERSVSRGEWRDRFWPERRDTTPRKFLTHNQVRLLKYFRVHDPISNSISLSFVGDRGNRGRQAGKRLTDAVSEAASYGVAHFGIDTGIFKCVFNVPHYE